MDLDLLLTGLRDIHIPEPVSMWPLAPALWAILLLTFAIAVTALLSKKEKKPPLSVAALDELNAIQKAYRHHQSKTIACTELSVLIRRIALAKFPRQQVAHLTGDAWLAFLDQTSGNKTFTQGAGSCVISAPYMKQNDINIPKTFKIIRRWIKQLDKEA